MAAITMSSERSIENSEVTFRIASCGNSIRNRSKLPKIASKPSHYLHRLPNNKTCQMSKATQPCWDHFTTTHINIYIKELAHIMLIRISDNELNGSYHYTISTVTQPNPSIPVTPTYKYNLHYIIISLMLGKAVDLKFPSSP